MKSQKLQGGATQTEPEDATDEEEEDDESEEEAEGESRETGATTSGCQEGAAQGPVAKARNAVTRRAVTLLDTYEDRCYALPPRCQRGAHVPRHGGAT